MMRRIGILMALITAAAIGIAYASEAAQTDMETLAMFGFGLSASLIIGGFLP